MPLHHFTTATDFLARAEPFLLAREAEHCLPLGLASALAHKPDLYSTQPYLAVATQAETVLAVAVRTPPYNLILSHIIDPAALPLVAEDVLARYGADLPGVIGPKTMSRAFAEVWHTRAGRAFRLRAAERIYRLTHVNAVAPVRGRRRAIAPSDEALLSRWLRAFQLEAFGEVDEPAILRTVRNMLTLPPALRGTFLWEVDGEPVSLTSYGGPTPRGMRVGPVYTPTEHRRQGYASALVAAVSQHLLNNGRQFVFLFTDLANPTSNHIYQMIGYEPVGDVDEYKFVAP
jgi:hypothetical protein